MNSVLLLVLAPLLATCSTPKLSPKQLNHTHELLKHIVQTHHLHLEHPLVDNEIFCRCTTEGCDSELVHVGGDPVRGMCRARGGVCRQTVITVANKGDEAVAVLDCVTPENLQPPMRPFACQNLNGPNSKDFVMCCNDTSFCNHYDVPLPKRTAELEKTGQSWHWLLITFFVACLFSMVGLLVGIFWFRSTASKNCMRNLLMCMPGNRNSVAFYVTNSGLNKLLDDIESQQKPTEVEAPVLARRTIARQIRLGDTIARGRFGEVWLGEWRGEKVAVKIFQSRDENSWRRETDIYSTNMLRHSNLLRWIASDNKDTGTSTQLWLITEYLPHGSLYEYLESHTISLIEAVQFVRSFAHGLSYLHADVPGVNNQCYKPGIAHRDLKSRNLLVKNDMTLAIADLGLAAKNAHGVLDVPDNGRGGTVRYLPPEYLDDTMMRNRFTAYLSADMYAFGLVVWEIVRRSRVSHKRDYSYQVPYYEFVQREPTIDEMRECVCKHRNRPTLISDWDNNKISRELTRIMTECWTDQPNSRLTALNVRYALDKLVDREGLKIMT